MTAHAFTESDDETVCGMDIRGTTFEYDLDTLVNTDDAADAYLRGGVDAVYELLARIDCEHCLDRLQEGAGSGLREAGESPSYRAAMRDSGRGGMLA